MKQSVIPKNLIDENCNYVVVELQMPVNGFGYEFYVWHTTGKHLSNCKEGYPKENWQLLMKEELQNECNLHFWSNHYNKNIVHITKVIAD